jgi:hypothetical protein
MNKYRLDLLLNSIHIICLLFIYVKIVHPEVLERFQISRSCIQQYYILCSFVKLFLTSWSTWCCPGKFNIACLTYWQTMILWFPISYRSWMVQNAQRIFFLFQLFFFWHFNIITVINPFSERFQSRPTFSVRSQNHFNYLYSTPFLQCFGRIFMTHEFWQHDIQPRGNERDFWLQKYRSPEKY